MSQSRAKSDKSKPTDEGTPLARLPRGKGREELRVTLKTYQGHPFVDLRVWSQDPRSGNWWPQAGKGVSVRVGELAAVIEALRQGLELAGPVQAVDRESPRVYRDHTRPVRD